MSDFFDDLLPPDLAADVLADPEMPDVIETDVVSETWFAEFDAVLPDVGDVPMPDPFAAETAVGASAAFGGLLARRRKPEPAAPAAGPSKLETITAAVDLAETTAPLVERLAKLARPKRKAR